MPFPIDDLDPMTQSGLMTLGAAMARLRAARGLSQRLLSRRSGVSQSSISRLEAGKAPWIRARNLARMLSALDASEADLDFAHASIRVPPRDPILELAHNAYAREAPEGS